MKFLKSFCAIFFLALFLTSGASFAATWTGTVNGTTYNFETGYGSYNDNVALFQAQPWWGVDNEALARQFATAVGTNLGLYTQPGGSSWQLWGPWFAYDYRGLYSLPSVAYLDSYGGVGSFHSTGFELNTHAFIAGSGAIPGPGPAPSPGVPEIDGSLIPQVGFLIACLFLMFGRKKQFEVRA